jgi:hypothetical protein
MAPKKPKPGQKYSWVESTDGIVCYKNPSGFQTLTKLWEANELTAFHDAALSGATKKINAVVDRLQRKNADQERTLSLIEFQNRLFLVWARYGAVGPYDDDAAIIKALKLKAG